MKNTVYKTVLQAVPTGSKVKLKQKEGAMGRLYSYFEVILKPELSEAEYEDLKTRLKEWIGDDLSEIYTEETGHRFFIYFKPETKIFT